MSPMRKIRAASFFLFISMGFLGCDKDPTHPAVDYFPNRYAITWRYINSFFLYPDSALYHVDTTTYHIHTDTLVNGKTYALLTSEEIGLKRGIRKQNGNYYSLSFEYANPQEEHLFLKDYLPTGSSWEELSRDGGYKHTYTIVAKLTQKNIRGKAFPHVIDVEERRFYKSGEEFYLHYVIQHSYARDIGEVYAYYPATSFRTYSDQAIEVLDYQRK
jgi:hypothetical protein